MPPLGRERAENLAFEIHHELAEVARVLDA